MNVRLGLSEGGRHDRKSAQVSAPVLGEWPLARRAVHLPHGAALSGGCSRLVSIRQGSYDARLYLFFLRLRATPNSTLRAHVDVFAPLAAGLIAEPLTVKYLIERLAEREEEQGGRINRADRS
jgi:hypothetical protein